jgi:uncharacterized protein (DUF2147 family)
MRKTLILLSIAATIIFPLVGLSKDPDAIIGRWYNEEKTSIIEIYKCGDLYCGKIVWLKEPLRNGKPKLDESNTDKKLRNQPILGMNILTNFQYDGDLVWDEGKIYDPRKGETYSCVIKMTNSGTLDIRGYVGFSLFGRSTTWTKAN